MLTTLILVCSISFPSCDRNNAVSVMQLPEQTAMPVMCQMHGQAFLAGTEMGRNIDAAKEYVRVLCVYPKGNIG